MYYLQTRYYNPETGRFINADAFVATGQGILGNNMFVYCGNNSVCNVDRTGRRYCEVTTIVGESKENREHSCGFQAKVVLSASLLPKGEPNSSQILPNPDGTPKQKRWYGPDGKAERDRDYNHAGNVEFPHDHVWIDGKRNEDHLPPSPEYEFSWEPIAGVGIVAVCGAGIAIVAIDDATGVGAVDDFLFAPLIAWLGEGISMLF